MDIRTQWRAGLKVTGRWGSANPNLQNIPKSLRGLFQAREGMYFVEADYSQLELRILAYLAQDAPLLKAYSEGSDVHTLNARDLFQKDKVNPNERKLAKVFVYGVNYGGSEKTIHQQLAPGFPTLTLEMVEKLKQRWEEAHPDIVSWQDRQLQGARKNKYVECPLSGRRFYFYMGKVEPTKCYNFVIQGTAADLMNEAILDIDKSIDEGWGKGAEILIQLHDAILLEGTNPPAMYELLGTHMEKDLGQMKFPVDISLGKTWGEMKEYDGKQF